jgi:hypothetical protein
MVFIFTLFYPLFFCVKKGGVIFDLDRVCIFNRSSIFVPEWPKWEFVSLWLATFSWTKSLLCKDAFKQGYNYSEFFYKILYSLQVKEIGSLAAVRMT